MLSTLMQRARRAAAGAVHDAAQLAFGFDTPVEAAAPVPTVPLDAPALLARLRALGLRHVDALLLTQNRRTMVSVKGRMLRVHEGYLTASAEVHAAIVACVMARRGAGRQAAMRTILAHAQQFGDAAPPARVAKTHPADELLAERLEIAHAELNEARFGGELQGIPVRVSRRMRTRLGHYSPAHGGEGAEIAISAQHLRRHGWESALETLLHEMVHQWQAERGLPLDHGAEFRRKARAVGIRPRATRPVD